jgi:hypothetical protein
MEMYLGNIPAYINMLWQVIKQRLTLLHLEAGGAILAQVTKKMLTHWLFCHIRDITP